MCSLTIREIPDTLPNTTGITIFFFFVLFYDAKVGEVLVFISGSPELAFHSRLVVVPHQPLNVLLLAHHLLLSLLLLSTLSLYPTTSFRSSVKARGEREILIYLSQLEIQVKKERHPIRKKIFETIKWNSDHI